MSVLSHRADWSADKTSDARAIVQVGKEPPAYWTLGADWENYMTRPPIRAKESDLLRQITDFLTVKGLLWFRMNSGGMFGQHNGKRWAVKFGMKGMADLLAFVRKPGQVLPTPLWIEAKTDIGRQSDVQKAFQQLVELHDHRYVLARSIDSVEEALKAIQEV